MKKIIVITQMIAVLAVVPLAKAQLDWQFGFELNEWATWWGAPHLEKLLNKLENLDTKGGINVNGMGCWATMQENAMASINFESTDNAIKLFQRHGFSLTWYLRSDAPWAFPNKPDCQPDTIETPFGEKICYRACAPEPDFEQAWINYVKAIVERYDGDGINDMPGLTVPIQFYIQQGEIKFGIEGTGDEQKGPFWFDNIDNLLRLHRITYEAIREADPTGNSRIVSSGALLSDLYADFPDWPEFDPGDTNSTIQQRLRGENYRGSKYTAEWDSLKKLLKSFGNDADGIECDYIGWHPHFNWRVIPQEFALIHAYAGNKPIFVDDMWTNIFSVGYNFGVTVPGIAIFHARPWPPANNEWIKNIEGDFPNSLFPDIDPYETLFLGLKNEDHDIMSWYYARQARNIVKSFVTAFGEGAERVCLSGTNDLPETRNRLYGSIGWINFLGTRWNYPEKPGYWTYKLLVDKLQNFTEVSDIPVSQNPLTRCYKFNRADMTSIYVLWSETGDAPPYLDYRNNLTGETVTFEAVNKVDSIKLTHIITDTVNTIPVVKMIPTQNGQFTIRLGYEPIFLEGDILAVVTDVESQSHLSLPSFFELKQNYPNPFNPETVIEYQLPHAAEVGISIFNLLGQKVIILVKDYRTAGAHKITWNGTDEAGLPVTSGLYIYQLKVGNFIMSKKMLLLR